ncbi:hypothetical protein QJQ45_017529 [Haematococcus lacustris]|nr:hypothetical protein QJQ45_017529 [Haematococcus lacustris]
MLRMLAKFGPPLRQLTRRRCSSVLRGRRGVQQVHAAVQLLTPERLKTTLASTQFAPGVRSLSSAELDDDEPRLALELGPGQRSLAWPDRAHACCLVTPPLLLKLGAALPWQAYEMVQGPLARWTKRVPGQAPPTAVLVHGILGRRQNMQSFARMLAQGFPAWQILLVDMRCHGESAGLANRPDGPHTVHSAAKDILLLLRELKLFPHVLIGHSFGGKVVMSMVEVFGTSQLPRPLQVWALDSLPGEVRSGEGDGRDNPAQLIKLLRALPLPITSRNDVINYLSHNGGPVPATPAQQTGSQARPSGQQVAHAGFSMPVARWAATNLRERGRRGPGLDWVLDLEGIGQMYDSYTHTPLWSLLERPPKGLKLDFVKAEHSTFRWGGPDEARITALGHQVHLLPRAGHWVHTDNPCGLFDILAPSFNCGVDLRQQRQAGRQ